MDRKLLYCTFLLAIGGMVMIYSSSSVMAESRFDSHFFFIKRQIMWLAIGLIAASVIIKVDLKKLSVYSVPALFITIILLAAVFIMPARNGSHRWLFLGPLSLQPSAQFTCKSFEFSLHGWQFPPIRAAGTRLLCDLHIGTIGCIYTNK